MEKLDLRGLSCPEPVLEVMKAVKSGSDVYEVTVDNFAAKENITRFAKNKGFSVKLEQNDDEYILLIEK